MYPQAEYKVAAETYTESIERPESTSKYYKPFILRIPALICLLCSTLLLVGLIEVACRRLPSANNDGIVDTLANHEFIAPSLEARDKRAEIFNVTMTTTVDGIPQTIVEMQSLVDDDCGTTRTCYVGATAYVVIGTVTIGGAKPVVGTTTILPAPALVATPTLPADSPPASTPEGKPDATPDAIPAATPATTPAATPAVNPASTPRNSGIVTTTSKLAPGATPALSTKLSGSSDSLLLSPTKSGQTTTTKPNKANPKSSAATALPSGAVIVAGSANETSTTGTEIIHVFTMRDYFLGAFLPTIVAVIFTLAWGILVSSAKEMEPFYQLASADGASASNSVLLDYSRTSIFLAPFKALLRGHWTVFIISLVDILALATAPLASEAVFIGLSGTCNSHTDNINAGGQVCIPDLSVYPVAARVLQGVLVLMALLTCALIFASYWRTSGIFTAPGPIATIASLFHNPELLCLFQNLPFYKKEKSLSKALQNHHFQLGHYRDVNGVTLYGFMLAPSSRGTISMTSEYDTDVVEYTPKEGRGMVSKTFRVIKFTAFALFLVGLMGMIIYYKLVNTDTGFERFMDSQAFGVRFLFTSIGVLITLFWDNTRRDIQRHEPYSNLSRGPSSARASVLLAANMNPFSSIYYSIRRGNFWFPLLDISTILCIVLTVTLTNIPFNNGITYLTFEVCVYLSLAIIAFMLLSLVVTLVHVLRFNTKEAVPETMAGVMALLAGGHMLSSFAPLADYKEKDRNREVESWGCRFGIGKVRGVDGVVRRGVDFEQFVDLDRSA